MPPSKYVGHSIWPTSRQIYPATACCACWSPGQWQAGREVCSSFGVRLTATMCMIAFCAASERIRVCRSASHSTCSARDCPPIASSRRRSAANHVFLILPTPIDFIVARYLTNQQHVMFQNVGIIIRKRELSVPGTQGINKEFTFGSLQGSASSLWPWGASSRNLGPTF